MIKITKGAEPQKWIDKKKTPGFRDYEPIPELRDALLKDQGYICGYCMRRIPVTKNDPGNSEKSKIEHIEPRKYFPHLQLEYNNMIICCPGYINSDDHCDKLKKSLPISFSPFDVNVELSIAYGTKDGKITSSNVNWNKDLNDVLALNNSMLKLNRQQVLEAVRARLEQKSWKKAELEAILKDWKSRDAEGKLKPYCGVVIWYLNKKLRSL
jgi:uncharacterized protein (TIGR02646 family)